MQRGANLHERLKQLNSLNLYSLEYRRLRGILIEAYKIITNKEDVDSDQFFTLSGTLHLRESVVTARRSINLALYKFIYLLTYLLTYLNNTSARHADRNFLAKLASMNGLLPEYVIAADADSQSLQFLLLRPAGNWTSMC